MNKKPLIFLFGAMFVLLGIMVIAYNQFQIDKPLIEKQQQEQQNPVLSPEQMGKMASNFINATTSTIHAPPPLP